jgi:hypothetical protein
MLQICRSRGVKIEKENVQVIITEGPAIPKATCQSGAEKREEWHCCTDKSSDSIAITNQQSTNWWRPMLAHTQVWHRHQSPSQNEIVMFLA